MPVILSMEQSRGRDILTMDNRHPTHQEAKEGFERLQESVLARPDGSVYLLVDASDSPYYPDVADLWRAAAPALTQKLAKAAVVTEHFAIRMAVKAVLSYLRGIRAAVPREVRVFSKKEDALEWLAG